MDTRKFTTIAAALLVLVLAGCMVQPAGQVVSVTTTPAPVITGEISQNWQLAFAAATHEALALAATSEAQARQMTKNAIDWQAAQAAQAAATATGAMALATQQQERYNAASTQQAIAVNATASAAAVDLANRQAVATQTAVAMSVDFVEATAAAALSDEQEIAAQEKERDAAIADLDRQTGFVLRLGFGALALIAGAILVYFAARLASVWIAIQARRWLVKEQMQFDIENGKWEPLPAYNPAMLAPGAPVEPEPQARPPIKIRQSDGEYLDHTEAIALSQERAARTAWKAAAIQFLRWAEAPGSDGKPQGFARRQFAQVGILESDYNTMTAWLADIGFLVKGGKAKNAPWAFALASNGEPLTASQIARHRFWLTSFDVPSPTAPDVPTAPKSHTPPPTTTTTNHHEPPPPPRTPQQNTENSTNIVDMPQARRYGLMGPPQPYLDENSPTSGTNNGGNQS